jgi:hypothetical protein
MSNLEVHYKELSGYSRADSKENLITFCAADDMIHFSEAKAASGFAVVLERMPA